VRRLPVPAAEDGKAYREPDLIRRKRLRQPGHISLIHTTDKGGKFDSRMDLPLAYRDGYSRRFRNEWDGTTAS
jgi:hypothetical protein